MDVRDILKRVLDGETAYPDENRYLTQQAILRAESIYMEFNRLPSYSEEGRMCLKRLLEKDIPDSVIVRPPFICDYGFNITLEDHAFINHGCTFLDSCPIKIGKRVMIAPNVGLYTASHPTDPEKRKKFAYTGAPITIEDDAWIGGNAVICPGVTVGRGSVIGTGSVVIKDVPPMTVAVGNPAKIIKKILPDGTTKRI